MCPELEIGNRVMSWLECVGMRPGSREADPDLAVKVYTRPAPEVELGLPEILRPCPVLAKTMEHLGGTVVDLWADPDRVQASEDALLEWGAFLQDRIRQVMQDIQIQHLKGPDAIQVAEQVVRIYLLVGHHLAASTEFQVNKKLHVEQRDKALMTLQEMYTRDRSDQPGAVFPNETEFWGYAILLRLGDQIDKILKQVPIHLLQHPNIRDAIDIHILYDQVLFYEFFDRIRCMSLLGACAIHHLLPALRRRALDCLHTGPSKNPLSVPLATAARMLGLESEAHAAEVLDYDGVNFTDHGVEFAAPTASSFTEPVTSHDWIYERQEDTPLGDIILSGQPLWANAPQSPQRPGTSLPAAPTVTAAGSASTAPFAPPVDPGTVPDRGPPTASEAVVKATRPSEDLPKVAKTTILGTQMVSASPTIDTAAFADAILGNLIDEVSIETLRLFIEERVRARKAQDAARIAEREHRRKIYLEAIGAYARATLIDVTTTDTKEVAAEAYDEVSADCEQFARFQTAQYFDKWRRASAHVQEALTKVRLFQQRQILKKWASAVKYSKLMRAFPDKAPDRRIGGSPMARLTHPRKPALQNSLDASILEKEMKRRRMHADATVREEERIDVLAAVATTLREKSAHEDQVSWKVCVVFLGTTTQRSASGTLPHFVHAKLRDDEGAEESAHTGADGKVNPTIRTTVRFIDAQLMQEDLKGSKHVTESLRDCSALIAVAGYPGDDCDDLSFRSTIASQWLNVAKAIGTGARVPVALLHDWPQGAARRGRVFDIGRLLCPDGNWPAVLQDNLHVQPIDLHYAANPGTAIEEVLRLCAARTWSSHFTKMQQLSLSQLFESAVAQNEPLQRFFRCTETWQSGMVDVSPLVRQLNSCGRAVLEVAKEALCRSEKASACHDRMDFLQRVFDSTPLPLTMPRHEDPSVFIRNALAGRLSASSVASVHCLRTAWQQVLAKIASVATSELGAASHIPLTRQVLPQLWPTWFLKLCSDEAMALPDACAVVTPSPRASLRRRRSEDAFVRRDVGSAGVPTLSVARPADAAHAAKRRHLDTLIEAASKSSTSFSDSLAKFIAEGAIK